MTNTVLLAPNMALAGWADNNPAAVNSSLKVFDNAVRVGKFAPAIAAPVGMYGHHEWDGPRQSSHYWRYRSWRNNCNGSSPWPWPRARTCCGRGGHGGLLRVKVGLRQTLRRSPRWHQFRCEGGW